MRPKIHRNPGFIQGIQFMEQKPKTQMQSIMQNN